LSPFGSTADLDHLGPELPQRLGRDLMSRAVGAVDDHPQALERHLAAQRSLGVFDVAGLDVVDALGAAEVGRVGKLRRDVTIHQRFDARLDLVGQFIAVRPEQLDAIVLIKVVGSGDHHPEVAAHRARQHRHCRGRHRPQEQNVGADGSEARDQRIFDHVAREPGVLANHHPMPMVAAAKGEPRRLPDLQGHIRRDPAVGPPPYAVGAKISVRHM
jgi:hypothetical protein